MNPSRLELEIEELVLHGFASSDRHRVAGAMQEELSRLFVEQGVPPALSRAGSIERLDAGAFEVKPRATPEAAGAEIARAIYGGLTE
ncbi:MAG TPA: hypothetical protein VKC34_16765 [Blastocatellia bacterium]|nr:hypothetical protein [Blastocatellia bacterium]